MAILAVSIDGGVTRIGLRLVDGWGRARKCGLWVGIGGVCVWEGREMSLGVGMMIFCLEGVGSCGGSCGRSCRSMVWCRESTRKGEELRGIRVEGGSLRHSQAYICAR